MAGKKGVPIPRYEESFKLGAVKLVVENGRSPKEVADELGVHVDTIKSWLKSSGYSTKIHKEKADNKKVRELESEVKSLKKQLEKKNEVIEVLKKSIGIISEI